MAAPRQSDLESRLRYEYFSPFSELNDHIVNLDLPVGLTSPPVPVQVGQSGPTTASFP